MTLRQGHDPASRKLTNNLLFAGTIFFLIHFAFSFFFFKERMLQEDAPFYIVKLVQQQRLVCEHSRYSSYLFQWIPYLAMKSGASLQTICKSYSVAFEVYYFIL